MVPRVLGASFMARVVQRQVDERFLDEALAVRDVLLEQTEAVAMRLRKHDLAARSVTIKIRFGDFETLVESKQVGAATLVDHAAERHVDRKDRRNG